MKKILFFLAVLFGFTNLAHAQEMQTYKLHDLTEKDYNIGKRQYLVYMNGEGENALKWTSLWTRTTKIVERDSEKLVEITQNWQAEDPLFQRELHSLNRLNNFAPISHRTDIGKDNVISAFKFSDTMITGDASVENNSKIDFSMPSQPETLNWELDIETLALVPWERGKTFYLNFYQPGSKTSPQAYAYSVIGDETLWDVFGRGFDCWMVKIDYDKENQNTSFATFWLEKETGQLIKMEETYGKTKRIKVLIGMNTQL